MASVFNFANLLLYGVPLLCAVSVAILLISAARLKIRSAGAKPDERGRLKAEEKARQYPVGRSVEVHYNAANPADAGLEVQAAGVGGLIGIAIIMGVIGAGWWLGANWLIRQ